MKSEQKNLMDFAKQVDFKKMNPWSTDWIKWMMDPSIDRVFIKKNPSR